MAADETIRFDYNIRYNIEGIDATIGKTKNLLFTLNAIRLSVRDIQMVMSGPTIGNVMWTAIQLTRVYTNLRRLIRATRAEQRAVALEQMIFTSTGGVGRAPLGLIERGIGFITAHPGPVGLAVGATIVVGGVILYKQQQQKILKGIDERNREVAKSQGLEY